jgi:hypothetical protein
MACQKASSTAGPSNDRNNPATDRDRPQGRPGLIKAPPALRAAFVFPPLRVPFFHAIHACHALVRVSMSFLLTQHKTLPLTMPVSLACPLELKTCSRGREHGTPIFICLIFALLLVAWPPSAFAQQWAKTQPAEAKPPPVWTPDRSAQQTQSGPATTTESASGEKPDDAAASTAEQRQPNPSQQVSTPQVSAAQASTPQVSGTPVSAGTAVPVQPAKKFADYLVPELLLYAGVGLIVLAGMIWIVQKTRELTLGSAIKKRQPTGAGFSVDELEKLRDQGLMSESEFNRAMKIARAQARATGEDAKPGSGDAPSAREGGKPADEKAGSGDASPPSPGRKSSDGLPPSGSSPDTRNGELW